MPGLDADTIRHALKTARERGLASVKLKQDGSSFRAVLDPNFEESWIEPAPAEAEVDSLEIGSPLVGYYSEAEPPLAPGLEVRPGDVVAQITALGLPNDVTASEAGVVEEVLVQPGQAVEYGQTLARMRRIV